jgi:hypothetical protein
LSSGMTLISLVRFDVSETRWTSFTYSSNNRSLRLGSPIRPDAGLDPLRTTGQRVVLAITRFSAHLKLTLAQSKKGRIWSRLRKEDVLIETLRNPQGGPSPTQILLLRLLPPYSRNSAKLLGPVVLPIAESFNGWGGFSDIGRIHGASADRYHCCTEWTWEIESVRLSW